MHLLHNLFYSFFYFLSCPVYPENLSITVCFGVCLGMDFDDVIFNRLNALGKYKIDLIKKHINFERLFH